MRLSDVDLPVWGWQVANMFTSKRATQAVGASPTKRNFFELTFAQRQMTTARRELRNYNKVKRELEQVRRIESSAACCPVEGGAW